MPFEHYSATRPFIAQREDYCHPEPESLAVDRARLSSLIARAGREVAEGLLPAAQLALASRGELVCLISYGACTGESLFSVFSATKALTSALVWRELGRGRLRLDTRVADLIPEFASHDKGAVTVLHLLTHTAGFPYAPFRPADWLDPERRQARFAQWRLDWPPGTRYEYHPTATMWVLAELIERVSGEDFRLLLRREVLDPLGLKHLYVGSVPDAVHAKVVDCCSVGEPLSSAELARLGLPDPADSEVSEDVILNFNRPETRAIGVPGGGAVGGAGEFALFYQALLPAGGESSLWSTDTLASAQSVHSGELKDPVFKKHANRGLGLVVAGDGDRIYRGFGQSCSASAFGHNGAGGQLAWADPQSGLSLAWLTSGHDRNPVRQASRGVTLSSLAADCALG
ncbi:MAG: serine hydrolase domain-containing protein [Pseudomonadota bacterium]